MFDLHASQRDNHHSNVSGEELEAHGVVDHGKVDTVQGHLYRKWCPSISLLLLLDSSAQKVNKESFIG